jgi:hypothetical protein
LRELNDLIGLLATIDLGVFAAALTLLALYPAIAGLSERAGIKTIVGNEVNRKKLFSWLGRTAVASGLALTLVLFQAVFGVLVTNAPVNTSNAGSLSVCQQVIAWIGVVLTVIGILAGARAGRLIFTMTSDVT